VDATHRRRLVDHIDPHLIRLASYRILVGPAANLIATVLSFKHSTQYCCLLVPLFYILPGQIDVHRLREAIQRAALQSSDDRLSWVFKTRHSLRPLSHDRAGPHMPSDAYRPTAAASDQRLALGCHGEGGRRVCDPLRSGRRAPYHAAWMQ